MEIIFPDITASKKAVPFPAKNGKGKKFFLVNLFLSDSIARKGTVVTIIIKNNRLHRLNAPFTKLSMKVGLPSLLSRMIVVINPNANPIKNNLRLLSIFYSVLMIVL